MHRLLTGNVVERIENTDEEFDGISGVYHTVGIMNTHDAGTLLVEYRVRGHGSFTALPIVDLSEQTIQPLTFTAPVTEWRFTVADTDDDGYVAVTDTQVKSSSGLVESSLTLLHELDYKVNNLVITPAIKIILNGTSSNMTVTHNFPHNPDVLYTNPQGGIGFADINYINNTTLQVSAVMPLLGELKIQ